MVKVESGTIRPGMRVKIISMHNVYKVHGVWANEEPVASAWVVENVIVKLNGCGMEDIQEGFVICSEPACRAVDKIICQIGLMDMPDNTVEEEATVTIFWDY